MEEPTPGPSPSPPPKKSFWERLGQGVAQGWEKAKEVSTRVGEYASLKLDIKNARDHLDSRYRLLGRSAADRLIDRGETTLESSESGVRAILDEIATARATLAALEKKLAESGQAPAQDDQKEEGEPKA